MKKLVLCSLLLMLIVKAFSQYPEIQFDRISAQQGLSDHSIHTIFQDHNGFIWIGGSNGLYKYDGYDFTFFKDPPGCYSCPSFKSVYKIQEDHLGLLWILSESGITLFDPEKERSVLLYPSSVESLYLSYNQNADLLRDSGGNIWASYMTGLMKISYKDSSKNPLNSEILFKKGPRNLLKSEIIQLSSGKHGQNNHVRTLYEDKKGNIFAGCASGLYFLKKGQQSFIRLDNNEEKKTQQPLLEINAIAQIDDNSYWIATENSLCFMTNAKMALHDSIPNTSSLLFSHKKIIGNQVPLSLLVDRHKNLLLGTNKDIYRIKKDVKTDDVRYELIFSNLTDPEYFGYNKNIQNIFEDRTGVLWTVNYYYGITKSNSIQSEFHSYKNLIINYFNSTDINPIFKDSIGNLWIGSYGGGLYKIRKDNFKVTQYDLIMQKNNIICMQETSTGYLWIGLNPGIIEFNSYTGKSFDPLPDTRIAKNLRGAFVLDLLKEGNRMFMGTQCGLFLYDITGERLFQYSFIKNDSLNDNYNTIGSLIKLKNGEVLAGTAMHGINKIDFNAYRGKMSLSPVVSNKLLIDNGINLLHRHSLYEDSNGLLWIVDDSGLHSVNMRTSEVRNYELFEKIDLPEAWSITEDDYGNFWIGTHFGLCRFNKETEMVTVFTKDDGLPITIHGLNSVYKDNDGRLFFGGIGGFYDFYPNRLTVNDSIPPIVITDLLLFSKSVKADTSRKAILDRNISYARSIELKYNQNDLSLKFAALDYNQPLNNNYSYKLEGYQDEWIETDAKNRIAHYAKLDPGKYIFKVKGSNSDNIWNEKGTSLSIIIHKPWWTTNLAWIIYIIIVISAINAFIRWRLHRLNKEKRELEKLIQNRTQDIEVQKERILTQRDLLEHQNKRIKENEVVKSRFFENISHEFRTPLSLIQSPVEELLSEPRRTEKERQKLNMVNRNALRLLNLVNQLQDISKIDGSKMKLELCESDVMKHLKAVTGSFISVAEAKSIIYRCHFATDEITSWYDPDKLEKITTNLLSNAFKFTPEGGEIELNARYVHKDDDSAPLFLEFFVKDTGPGISKKYLDRIFDRFYQVEESRRSENIGTGIGLSLARDLARMMHGDITIQSDHKNGSTFTVHFPLGKNHLKEDEFIILENFPEMIGLDPAIHFDLNDSIKKEKDSNFERGKPVILVVDDNRDIRAQLNDNLKTNYCIKEAVDGIAGLKKTIEIIPDLIITDLMMPKMDGTEMCKQLKANEITSHIPIIMLTARDTLEDKITGLQIGADEYIPKPFNMTELRARVANLLEQRKVLRERFSREITLEPRDISITPLDETFLNKAISIVEENMNNENFNLTVFRQKMSHSRSTLYRKLYALTGQSPTEFIRTIRLKRAASLLKQKFGNVTEVSLEVGFNNLSYFNRSFKTLYGISPTEFAKTQ